MRDEDDNGGLWKLIKILIGIVVVMVLLLICNPISCVGPAQRGIQVVGGKPGDTILQPGINFHVPVIGKIQKYSIGPRTYDLVIDIENRGAVSKDNQIIGAEGKIVWAFDPEKIDIIVKNYPEISAIENIIKNTSYEALKTVIGGYTIYDLPGNMAQIGQAAFTNLKSKLGGYPIIVSQFNVTNFDWSPDFDKRINDTMAAQQKVKEMEQQAAITEQQSKQQVIKAEAEAKALIAEADGRKKAAELNAAAAITTAQGLAEANRIKAAPSAMEFQKAEWDYNVKMERAKHLAPGVEVPMYIPLAPNGTAAVISGK